FRSQFLTAAGGPLVNLAICMLIFPALLWIPGGSEAFMPLALPITSLSANWGQDLLVLTFFVNWLLTIINLLPIYPLDGGRMMEACLMGHGTAHDRRSLCLKIGMFAALAIAIGGLLYDNVWIVAFGAWILVLNLMESAQLQQAELYDESFMGYDFSQGYTSLERSSHASAKPVRKSMWQQWQEKRREEKQRQQEQQQQLEAAHLDELLAKVHAQGVQSLTSEERKFLNRASRNYRTRNG
ncbi:MAG: M50 family metallopeptidase, partial [Planctomycetaceae bacterium]|nr:M50 family metallopeptidase [Planctomycetaceae bacterium]